MRDYARIRMDTINKLIAIWCEGVDIPHVKVWAFEDGTYLALDNSGGDCLCESFDSIDKMRRWIRMEDGWY